MGYVSESTPSESLCYMPRLEDVALTIADPNANIVDRMRAIFTVRRYGSKDGITALLGGLNDDSVLLVHEIAYVLGQMGEEAALPHLTSLLRDKSRHCMIRHEAAEALAAIGSAASLGVVAEHTEDVSSPVRETCVLALRSLREKIKDEGKPEAMAAVLECAPEGSTSPAPGDPAGGQIAFFHLFNSGEGFTTVDPVAKKNERVKRMGIAELRRLLLDESAELYDRYEALFALRDRGTIEAAAAVIDAMQDNSSPLFRHEVAYVLGQIQSPESVLALVRCLQDSAEHAMARHEAALALGSVVCGGSLTDATRVVALQSLLKFSNDSEPIVAESCLVALDNIAEETGACTIDSTAT